MKLENLYPYIHSLESIILKDSGDSNFEKVFSNKTRIPVNLYNLEVESIFTLIIDDEDKLIIRVKDLKRNYKIAYKLGDDIELIGSMFRHRIVYIDTDKTFVVKNFATNEIKVIDFEDIEGRWEE